MPETSEHASVATPEPTVLDQSTQGHLDRLYQSAIGTIRTDYYLPVLSRFETYGRASPSWNWAACLCTLNWMLFRRLWLAALLYLAAVGASVAVVVTTIALQDPPMVASLRWSVWAAWATMVMLVPGLFGNAWLYRAYRQRVDEALGRTARLQDACQRLAQIAPTRQRLALIVAVNLALALLLAIGLWPPHPPTKLAPHTSGLVDDVPMTQAQRPSAPTATVAPRSPAEPVSPPVSIASPSAEVPRPQARPETATSPATESPAATTVTVSQPRFLINVGLFAQTENAGRVHAQLASAGLPVSSTVVAVGNGSRTRVRVGPFTTRAQADTAAQRIHSLKLDAVVIRQ